MLIFHSKYRSLFSRLEQLHKKHIIRYIVIVNIFFILVISGLLTLLHQAKMAQDRVIKEKTTLHTIAMDKTKNLWQKIPVYTKVYLLYIGDINLKEKLLTVYLGISLKYDQKTLVGEEPNISIVNGTIRSNKLIKTQQLKDSEIEKLYIVQADIEPSYMLQLYPLDRQLVAMRLTPENMDANYYLQVTGFYDYSQPANDYTIDREGYLNQIESYHIYLTANKGTYYNVFSRIYLLFNHQNIFTYIKNIQYVVLSLLLSIFALLINSRSNSPLNGRVAVIGGSVFALAANIFQINATIKPIGSYTIIDLITVFASTIILSSFLITIRSLSFADDGGYETAKTFDVAMFSCLMVYVIAFFVLVYWYV